MPLEIARRGARRPLKVVPRFVYNPEKAERGLKALADILAEALRRRQGQASGTGDRGPGQ